MIEKFLYQPVEPFFVNQYFGEDRACLQLKDGKTVVGKENNATCPVGYRSLYHLTQGHNGLDLRGKRWDPVYAAHSGTVTEVETEGPRGLGVGIVSDEERFFSEVGKKSRYKTRYWHLIAVDVDKWQKVRVGDLIGYVDSTGYSTADHLHFELKPVIVFAKEPLGNKISYRNALSLHLGAINPLPYMETKSALYAAGQLRRIGELIAQIANWIADKARRK